MSRIINDAIWILNVCARLHVFSHKFINRWLVVLDENYELTLSLWERYFNFNTLSKIARLVIVFAVIFDTTKKKLNKKFGQGKITA